MNERENMNTSNRILASAGAPFHLYVQLVEVVLDRATIVYARFLENTQASSQLE